MSRNAGGKPTSAKQDDTLDLLWEEATPHPVEPPQAFGSVTNRGDKRAGDATVKLYAVCIKK